MEGNTASKMAVLGAGNCGGTDPDRAESHEIHPRILNGYRDDKEIVDEHNNTKSNGFIHSGESKSGLRRPPANPSLLSTKGSDMDRGAASNTNPVDAMEGATNGPLLKPESKSDLTGNSEDLAESGNTNSDDSQSAEEKESGGKRRTSERNKHRKESQEENQAIKSPAPNQEVLPREKLPPVERPIMWGEGDLVWSLVSGHPLWPCMVTKDPLSESHTRLKGSGHASVRAYHVQFFGNSPEHAWVNGSRIHKFSGKDGYETLVHAMAKSKQKRPPKVEISKRFIENWNAAIEEIAVALPMLTDDRMKKFTFVYVKNMPRKVHAEASSAITVDDTISENAGIGNNPVDVEHTNVEKAKSPNTTGKLVKNDNKATQQSKRSQLTRGRKSEPTKSHTDSDIVITSEKNPSVKKLKGTPKGHAVPNNRRRSSANENDVNQDKKKENLATPYECMYCPDLYFTLDEMRDHCTKKHPEHEAWKNKNHLLDSENSSGASATVSLPRSAFSPASALPVEDTSINCTVCGETFVNRRSLGQHRRFSHPGVSLSSIVSVVIPLNDALVAEESNAIGEINCVTAQPKPKTEPTGIALRQKPRPQVISQARKEPICVVCEKNGDVLSCTGDCFRSFHAACLVDYEISDPFVCKDCKNSTHACIICGKSGADWLGKLKRCVVPLCGRYFHGTCLQIYTLKGLPDGAEKLFGIPNNTRCPSHSCATCMSKSLVDAHKKGGNLMKSKSSQKSKLFKCIRCPTAYHVGDDCIAAGSVILGGLHIVCPGHFNPVKSLPHHHPVHISWCFVCSKGGELICCATCPAAFHAQCIDLDKTPEGDWHCLDCSCGVRPLYDDIIWVKLGTYRWWPGQVIHPSEVPDNISRRQHGPGEFVVRFFGSNDYFWLSKYRVFLYQEGDNGATNRHCSRGISGVFKKALQEAEEKFAIVSAKKQLQEEVKTAENDKKPAPYKHIKCNKPVGRVQIYQANLGELAKCVCKRNDLHPCGPECECLNRMLMYECHPLVCPAGDRCENQRFQKCDYPETEVFKTDWGGWGLKTKVFIKKGSFVNEYVGELVDEEECRFRIERSHETNVTNFYMLTIDKDRIIDAGPKGNFSRFMNHCCDPNCETQKWMVNGDTRVGLFAVRDIMPGEELTFNYNLDCLGNDKTKCMCGSENCSGYIGVRPKPQSGTVVKKDIKKRRKARRSEPIPQHDDFCFRCRQTGTLVCCDYKGCLRAFCLDCLHIQKPPYGKWECPCHHCDWCGRRAQYFCTFCPNSFCGSHVQNQLHPSVPNGFDTCLDHGSETAEFEMAETIATVNELMNASTEDNSEDSRSPPQKIEQAVESAVMGLKKGTFPADTESGYTESGDRKNAVGQKRKRESAARKNDKKLKGESR